MTDEPNVIVRGEVDVAFIADQGFCAGDSLVHPEERIGDAEKICGFADHVDFPEPIEFGHVESGGRDTALFRAGPAR